MDLARRSTAEEIMDSDAPDAAEYARCLVDLARLNVVTMTHRPTLRWLRRATRDLPPGQTIHILDVACGHGDLLRVIHRWAARAGLSTRLEGIDLNPRSAVVAAAATPPGMAITWRTGDVFAYAPDPAPDFIVSSQFAHHLTDAQVVEFLRWLERHAARGWFIADLQRHVLAYWGFHLHLPAPDGRGCRGAESGAAPARSHLPTRRALRTAGDASSATLASTASPPPPRTRVHAVRPAAVGDDF